MPPGRLLCHGGLFSWTQAPTVAGWVRPSLGPPLCCGRSPGGSTWYGGPHPEAGATGPPPPPAHSVLYGLTDTHVREGHRNRAEPLATARDQRVEITGKKAFPVMNEFAK